MPPLQIPYFATLATIPSWCNSRGKIDRSSCVEIKVSELRRIAGCVRIDQTRRDHRHRPLHITQPLQHQRPARRRFPGNIQRLVTGIITVSARNLHELHVRRMPRRLAGDFRTARANVMRSHATDPRATNDPQHPRQPAARRQTSKFKCRVTRAQPIAWPPDRGLPPNSNAGACRTKIIGLHGDWSQPIRVEQWLYPRRIRPVYFMICPGSFNLRDHREHRKSTGLNSKTQTNKRREHSSIVNRRSSIPDDVSALSAISAVDLPPLSTRPPGRLHPSKSRGACPQRCLKLMMVQCTRAEAIDAGAAQLWIDSLPDDLRLREPYMSHIHRLIARYGPIMQPRRLLCPRCLGVAYGNNPETVRQSWRRRNNKPDTSPIAAANAHLLADLAPMDHWTRYNHELAMMKMNSGGAKGRKKNTS